jgi:long-chain fatty acid transport protein
MAGAALLVPGASAAAQGFGLNEVGSCAVARGFAVTSAPCADASAIYWNPAATADLPGRNTLSVGASSIAVHGSFTQDLTQHNYPGNLHAQLVPSGFYSGHVGPFALGFGVYVPYGLTSQWYLDFPGRFSAIKASLQNVYYQPNVAYKVNEHLSIGAGPILAHSQVKLIQALDLSQQVASVGPNGPITFGQLGFASGTQFATGRLEGSATAARYNAGIHVSYGPWQLGARYLSAITFHYDNAKVRFEQTPTGLILAQGNPITPGGVSTALDAVLGTQFTGTGALTPQGGASAITDPWQAQGGIAYSGLLGTTLSADAARIGWSKFQTLPVNFKGAAAAASRTLLEDYHDSWSYRFGAEHTVRTGPLTGWSGRAGYSYAESPAPAETVTPLLPDMNRRNASFGLGIPFGTAYSLDASYLHVNTGGRRGRIVERTSASQTAAQLNSGVYDLSANVFSVALRANF